MSNTPLRQWPAKRLRYLTLPSSSEDRRMRLADLSEVSFLPMQAIGDHGQLDLSATRPIADVQAGYSQFFDGDVVVAKITPCFENGKGALIQGARGGAGFGTTELHVLTPGPELDGQFLYYVTMDPNFRQHGEASMTGTAGQRRVPETFIRNYRVNVPALSEQRTISAYLDREIMRLDALVAEKNRVLGLIAERCQALITHAVTRGLDPDASFRDSGLPWLGKIPEHWDTERSKWLFKERDQRSTTGEENLLTVSHLTGVTPRSQKNVNMFEASTKKGYKICLSGDLVVNTMWAWMGAMGVTRVDGIVSPAYNVYKPGARLDPGYIDAVTRLPVFAQEVTRHSKGVWSSRLRLYPQEFFAISLPVPPLDEQREIAAHIEKRTSILDELHAATRATTALLSERRTALIAAAVAGHIDVGGDP